MAVRTGAYLAEQHNMEIDVFGYARFRPHSGSIESQAETTARTYPFESQAESTGTAWTYDVETAQAATAEPNLEIGDTL
jgi:hypothetical protein